MTRTVYLNGRFVSDSEARIRIDDGGWLHGAGLFETLRAENGRVFRLESHLERLCRSASRLLAPMERSALPSAETLAELLESNHQRSARVRLTVSSGAVARGTDAALPAWTVCVTTSELPSYPLDCYRQGTRVAVCDFRLSPTDPTAGHKTTGFLPRLLGLRAAQEARCFEAIWFTTDHYLAEGSISNVFLVRGGVLKTPPVETPVLPGIARGIVLEIAERLGISVRLRPLTINDLLDADEVMLTNSIMQVMPVIRVEKHDIGDARVGPVAGQLLREYRNLVLQECSEP